MTIKAKMKCSQVTCTENGDVAQLSAVTATTEENKTYSKYTPSASLSINITNPDACGFFKPGKSYVLDFTESE